MLEGSIFHRSNERCVNAAGTVEVVLYGGTGPREMALQCEVAPRNVLHFHLLRDRKSVV